MTQVWFEKIKFMCPHSHENIKKIIGSASLQTGNVNVLQLVLVFFLSQVDSFF